MAKNPSAEDGEADVMPLTWDEIRDNALAFSKKWEGAKSEKSDAQSFCNDFFKVFGVGEREYERERRVHFDKKRQGFIDGFLSGCIGIEMKSGGKSLDDAHKQLREYVAQLDRDEKPDLEMACDFETIRLYRRSEKDFFAKDVYEFKTKDLYKYIRRFAELAGYANQDANAQVDVNRKAAEKMAKLHDALKASGYEGHDVEVYLVRLLFCLFAEDTQIFPEEAFFNYVGKSKSDGTDLSERIARLFEVLNMPDEVRAKRLHLPEELKAFRYINGRLFEAKLSTADFDAKMRNTLLDCCLFDWGKISPAIFGAMFQGVMDKEVRRDLGAHYTSEENILKLIKPLFLDDLKAEFENIKAKSNLKKLRDFHQKIASLKFLDPACGCGNFLMITYRELRLLELEVLKSIHQQQRGLDISLLVNVNVEQFYGIEIEDFPCQIAQVGMWLVDHQMNLLASEAFGQYFERLPLTSSATIVHGNALRLDWEEILSKEKLSYILGNPPFIGYSYQDKEQKEEMLSVCVDAAGKSLKSAGKIDYVAGWYYKAAQMMRDTKIRAAFVSTNSITQGEQAALIWKPLIESFSLQIDFGYRTFKWSNEAKGKAAVHCVIVGFSDGNAPCVFVGDGLARPDKRDMDSVTSLRPHLTGNEKKTIFDGDNKIIAQNINGYLIDAPSVFIESRNKPLGDVPEMMTGNRPADGGHLIIEDAAIKDFLHKEPKAENYIKRFMGSEEFINNRKRWCLWLVNVSASELRQMPEVMKRIAACRKDREESPDEGRRKLAQTPTLFRETNNPDKFIVIPKVSSEKRKYVPIDFLTSKTIASDLLFIIPSATLYHFGILTSNVHNAWMRAVCGRLKSDYRYSKDIVYNNFVWADKTDKQKEEIEKLAQAVLDARAMFPDSSLADLYDPLTMPQELIKAHAALDRAVMKLYGYSPKTTEAQIVADLMKRYQALTERTAQLFVGDKGVCRKRRKRT
ncbi:MAG: N-6 DNA methylase [Zoogloeaceae bacterium]|jgi:type I restriction-modification system DNA methylase subunit|nr:N-6 DNA methylase [Zoogloeaceae bacterium]